MEKKNYTKFKHIEVKRTPIKIKFKLKNSNEYIEFDAIKIEKITK